MNRLPKGHRAQITGLRVLQTMYTAEQLRKEIAKEREACANIAHQWSKREDDVGGYIEAAIRARGSRPTTVIYSPGELAARGLTHEDVVKLIKENT